MSEDEPEHYSAALDEIFRLRRAFALEARVVEAHYEGYKTFPKSRRPIAEAQVKRMREVARGGAELAYGGEHSNRLHAYAREAFPPSGTLTRHEWENRDV